MSVNECICPKECDCQNPEPKNGAALISMSCPEHNIYPDIVQECGAESHLNGASSTRKVKYEF